MALQKILAAVGAFFLIAIAYNYFTNTESTSNLQINNLRSGGLLGDLITGRIINEGQGVTAYTWIIRGDNIMCPHRSYFPARSTTSFEFNCYPMMGETGRFSMRVGTNPPDWVRNNATSL